MPQTLDLRELDPPEPLLRILDHIETGPGPHAFLLSREPWPLYPLLAGAGWRHSVRRDGATVVLTVTRREAKPREP